MKGLRKLTHLLLLPLLVFSFSACAEAPSTNSSTVTAADQANTDKTLLNSSSIYESKENVGSSKLTKDGKVELLIGERLLHLEFADSPEERALGLMYRRSLCEDCGMLFKFDSLRVGSIWMKNTFIPLDLAYIDAEGKIVDIFQLQAHNLTPVKSSTFVLYALEMNEGWFAKQDIRVGDTVSQLP